jgi:NAD(P)-dependent dehydrogenase (short-subunit alcohol dehydrogenase family)
MRLRLRPLERQVIVITGATSGIGLATARAAAARGAHVVIAARNTPALIALTQELAGSGAEVLEVTADVSDPVDVKKIADAAIERFGRIDTWVNNAAVAIYGKLTEVPIEDQRRLFDIDFWGVVYGSLAAVEHLREGGALINVGSVLSDRAIPIQGTYSAAKHAVKGFTDALRMELEKDGLPISVTLIKPASIDTPYLAHAQSYLDEHPNAAPPVYAPDHVAKAILFAAEHPVRDLFVGGAAKLLSWTGARAPRLLDRLMGVAMFRLQRTTELPVRTTGTLYAPGRDLDERGPYQGRVFERSAYSALTRHPWLKAAAAVASIAAVAAVARSYYRP